ncbi:MAG: Flp pilus assembly complex ATPase component TadA [Clostridia bacterium]|nr:Flp pilus assembly complex ATPase component TadA [Clostridia bacterium]
MNKGTKSLLCILPDNIKEGIINIGDVIIEEIRIKSDSRVFVYSKNKEYCLYYKGEVIRATSSDINFILKKATDSSFYAFDEKIKQGYITVFGGHRIGISGEAVYGKDGIINIKNISFLNIRCANEIMGAGEEVFLKLFNERVENTLIVSPPKCGKTTLLRDLTRLISKTKGIKVVLIDERDEIAASFMGSNANDVGERTFVLSGYLKKDGFSHAIRGLSPDVVVCDEIGGPKDFLNILDASKRGVNVIATIHGNSMEDIGEFKGVFKNIVFLDKNFKLRLFKIRGGDFYEL